MVQSAAAGLIAHARELHKLAIGNLQNWGSRVASWLVVGNAAALVIGFNATVNGTICDRAALEEILWTFAVGLGTAFLGVVISLGSGIFSTQLLGDIANILGRVEMDEINQQRIEARFGPQPDDSALNKSIEEQLGKLPALQKRLSTLFLIVGFSVLFYIASAALFARGTLLPVLNDSILQTCGV